MTERESLEKQTGGGGGGGGGRGERERERDGERVGGGKELKLEHLFYKNCCFGSGK